MAFFASASEANFCEQSEYRCAGGFFSYNHTEFYHDRSKFGKVTVKIKMVRDLLNNSAVLKNGTARLVSSLLYIRFHVGKHDAVHNQENLVSVT